MRVAHGGLVVAALAAGGCGEVQARSGDLDGVDGGDEVDGGTEPGDVKVTFLDGLVGGVGAPLVGVPAYFIGPDGALIHDAPTDEEGVAFASGVPAGSSVTFLVTYPGGETEPPIGPNLSILGLEPGDDIVIGGEYNNGEHVGSMSFSLTPYPGASYYYVDNGCTSTSSNDFFVALDFFAACVADRGDDFTWLVRADDSSGVPVAYAHGQADFISGDTIVVDQWVAAREVSVTFVDPSATATSAGTFFEPVAGRRAYVNTAQVGVPLAQQATVVSLPAPTGFGEGLLIQSRYQTDRQDVGTQRSQHMIGPDDDALEIDMRDDLLPWYGQPFYSFETREIVMSRTEGTTPDVVAGILVWQEPGEDGGSRVWYLIGPADRDRLEVPRLPEAIAERAPVDPTNMLAFVYAIETSAWQGYDDARQVGFAALFQNAAEKLLEPGGYIRRSIFGEF